MEPTNSSFGKSDKESRGDVLSALILGVCLFASCALAITGLIAFIMAPEQKETLSSSDMMERVRDGELPEAMVRMAYDEVKRLTNTPVDSQIQWSPNASHMKDGLVIFGTVLNPKGDKKEFFVRFSDKDPQIIESDIREQKNETVKLGVIYSWNTSTW